MHVNHLSGFQLLKDMHLFESDPQTLKILASCYVLLQRIGGSGQVGWNPCSNGFNCFSHVLKMPKDKKLADKDMPMRSGSSGMQERIRDLLGPC